MSPSFFKYVDLLVANMKGLSANRLRGDAGDVFNTSFPKNELDSEGKKRIISIFTSFLSISEPVLDQENI